jgi:hypothetical protein
MVPLEKLEELLPPARLAELALALEVNAPNQVRLSGQAVLLCWLTTVLNHPVVTQRLLEETYTELFGCQADHSSFGKRLAVLNPAYFEALFRFLSRELHRRLGTDPSRGLRVRRVDATTVTLSAKLLHFGLLHRATAKTKNRTDRRHLKTVVSLSEAGVPELLRLCKERCETNDNHALGPAMQAATAPGDLWVFDRGCKDRDRLLSLHRAGAFFLTPHCGQRLREQAEVWRDPAPPTAQVAAQQALAQAAQAAPREPAPYQLQRVVTAVFENGEDAQHPTRQAKWATLPLLVFSGVRYSPRSRQWEPLVLLTNLPLAADRTRAGPYPLGEVPELYRSRWDLEVFFKFVKQHLSWGHLTSRCENGITLLLWVALLAALLLQWYQRESGIDRGWRSVKYWLAADLRAWTQEALRRSLPPGPQPPRPWPPASAAPPARPVEAA